VQSGALSVERLRSLSQGSKQSADRLVQLIGDTVNQAAFIHFYELQQFILMYNGEVVM
jgi:hypothetical protein